MKKGSTPIWTLGMRRRIKRYREAGLSLAEMALLLNSTRGAVAAQVHNCGLSYTVEQQREMQARQSWERAKHGRRSKEGRSWDDRLFESWEARKARRIKERAEANPDPPRTPTVQEAD